MCSRAQPLQRPSRSPTVEVISRQIRLMGVVKAAVDPSGAGVVVAVELAGVTVLAGVLAGVVVVVVVVVVDAPVVVVVAVVVGETVVVFVVAAVVLATPEKVVSVTSVECSDVSVSVDSV